MSELSTTMAKLAGIRQAVDNLVNMNVSRNRSAGDVKTRSSFVSEEIQHYFFQAASHLQTLKKLLPDLFGDFQNIETWPQLEMVPVAPGQPPPKHFSRAQALRLVRDIDQVFEIRANSQLAYPTREAPRRVFITHGRSNDWRAVQAFIEKDVQLRTTELAQEPNAGQTLIEKLESNADRCDSAVIVMTGDDVANGSESRVRENVMHEIGFFQGRYGRKAVILLHEEDVNIPSNLGGVAYIPFPKGRIEAGFHVLQRELRTLYAST
jgi:predicted nucleotide-binding protein